MPGRHLVRLALAALALAATAGCDLSPSEPDPPVLLQGDLVPASGESPISGSVAAVTQFAETRISVAVSGLSAGQTLSWHLREGNCAGSGTVFGSPSAYPQLVGSEAGQAEEEATFPLRLRPGRSYAGEVMQAGSTLACANLQAE